MRLISKNTFRKIIFPKGLFVSALFLSFFIHPEFSYSQKSFALVELFTSEGCASCPAADKLLSEVKNDSRKTGQNVVILSYHVDYWNRLGWKDPLSKKQFTIRQENYSRVMPGKEMFTPQAIVNGKYSFTGSDKKQMNDNIEKVMGEKSNFNLTLKIDSMVRDSAFISYSVSPNSVDYSLRLVLTEDGLSNDVKDGENKGKTLHHDGVVRFYYSIDSPKSGSMALPVEIFSGEGTKRLVGFVQKKKSMEIVAVSESILR